MSDISKLYETYAANMARFPALYDELAAQLGVSAESVFKLGVGFLPVDEHGNWAWVFPERNSKGEVIGLSKRIIDKPKYMVSGSKHGFIYAVRPNTEQYENYGGWVRTSVEYPCPLCDKPDGCLYPEGEYDNPNAVICRVVSVGATKEMEFGHLHVFDSARQKLRMQNYSLLTPSEHPVLIVEGASDVCAAYDLGFTAIGKYTNKVGPKGSKMLADLLSGRRVVILGENDAGAGKAGMESTFAQLQNQCPDCTMLMPPEGVKDLRQWKEKELTQQNLLEYIEQTGMKTLGPDVFDNDIARTIARNWLKYQWTIDGQLGLRIFENRYAMFDGCTYKIRPKIEVEGSVHDYLEDKKFVHENGDVKPYKATAGKVNDILKSCSSFFPIEQPVPSWIGGGSGRPNPVKLVVFTNGMLDVMEWIKTGQIVMCNHDARLFSFTQIPYDFNEDFESKLTEDFIKDTFNGDKDSILLASEWYGYNLVPDRLFEKMMILLGVIRSGKGTMINMLIKMLGEQNCASTTFQGLAGHFGRESLLGKLGAVIPDARGVKNSDMQQALEYILLLTGGDPVPVNQKHVTELPIIYLPCRFTAAMNLLPPFVDHTAAFEARSLILKFNNSHMGKEDFTLKTQLAKEAAKGKLINFALRGLKRLYTDMKFVVPVESAKVLRTFRETVSPVTHFTDKCIEADRTGPGVLIDELYELSKWWRDNEGLKPMAKNKFIQALQATMPHAVQIVEGGVGNHDLMMMGIKMTDWATKAWQKG